MADYYNWERAYNGKTPMERYFELAEKIETMSMNHTFYTLSKTPSLFTPIKCFMCPRVSKYDDILSI